MKSNLFFTLCLGVILCFALPATVAAFDQVSVNISEDNDTCQLLARYDESRTKKIRGFMGDCLTSGGSFSFKNTQTDAELTLDSKISFYMKSSAGKLVLKFNKKKNSTVFYDQFKKMCEGIKTIITEGK